MHPALSGGIVASLASEPGHTCVACVCSDCNTAPQRDHGFFLLSGFPSFLTLKSNSDYQACNFGLYRQIHSFCLPRTKYGHQIHSGLLQRFLSLMSLVCFHQCIMTKAIIYYFLCSATIQTSRNCYHIGTLCLGRHTFVFLGHRHSSLDLEYSISLSLRALLIASLLMVP